MIDRLRQADLFEGLSEGTMQRLAVIGRVRSLRAGEYLFLLGDSAQHLCVVLKGQVELCFPISAGGVVRDISVETVGVDKTVGWSALVKPFRFTLSARAAEPVEVMAFARHDIEAMLDGEPGFARVVLGRISELIATRLAMFEALWARELQRTLDTGRQA
jgi:CRP/FNR family transcriptional regulator, cyclic AMP receptor protein